MSPDAAATEVLDPLDMRQYRIETLPVRAISSLDASQVSAAWTRSGPNPARDAASALLRSRGDQPRQRQNRLLFLAADTDQVMHLKETVRALLAWRSIETDIRELRLNLVELAGMGVGGDDLGAELSMPEGGEAG